MPGDMSQRVVWKYPLAITDNPVVSMPDGAIVLKIECQGGHPCLWALVNPEAPYVPYKLTVLGTGHTVGDRVLEGLAHLATFQQAHFVWHVFGSPELREGDRAR